MSGKDEIYTEELEFSGLGAKSKFFRLPLIRGVVGMIDSMRLSYKALMISADKAIEGIPEDEQEEPSKLDKWLDEHMGEKFLNVFMTIAMILGVLIAIVLFLKEACLEHDAAAVNLAIYFFRVFSKTDALNFRTTFDYHRRTFNFQVFDYNHCIAVE